MSRYYVAKANATAQAFVVRSENYKSDWFLLHDVETYAKACALRDARNGAGFTLRDAANGAS